MKNEKAPKLLEGARDFFVAGLLERRKPSEMTFYEALSVTIALAALIVQIISLLKKRSNRCSLCYRRTCI
ncbi:MAG: hypothetical protein FWG10_08835 [Eubacteriaceae bacterium]|nr:hypothetical protein [Eubacteriaceae bacterium]